MLPPYASLFFSHPCLMHSSLHSSPCGAWLWSSLPFCHHHVVASCSTSIPRLCLIHAPNVCCHILSLCWDSLVDLTHTRTVHTYSSSIKGPKCQPENSSLVLLVFSPQQPVRSSPKPTTSAFSQSSPTLIP